jgi:EVE domain
MKRYWVVVASADHVARGVAGGFVQACHGKRGPLRRMNPGDGVLCYSPTVAFGGKERLQAFTAIGVVDARDAYIADMGGGFRPYRSDIVWMSAQAASIRPLVDRLGLTRGRTNWGGVFRFGFCAIGWDDFVVVAAAMGVDLPHGSPAPSVRVSASQTRKNPSKARQGVLFDDGAGAAL